MTTIPKPKNVKDITGRRYGRFTVIGYAGKTSYRTTTWLCRCDCGREVVILKGNLSSGQSTNCGCVRLARLTKHGMWKHSAYQVWSGMLERCCNAKCASYSRYGGRGIKVCQAWRSVENFCRDMGERPKGKSIDRINFDGHYSCGKCEECIKNGWPANCRWATTKEQCNNTSYNHPVTIDGRTQNINQWCSERGIKQNAVGERMRRGWTAERAIMTPMGPSRRYPHRYVDGAPQYPPGR